MDPAAGIEELIAPPLAASGYRIVRVRLLGGARRVLQVMAERSEAEGLDCGMTVDDCAEISRTVSAILDVEDPISGTYTLEVSSPGIDRPLVGERDFERFAGFEARLETHAPIDGRKRFKGRLLGVGDASVRLAMADREVKLPLAAIARAKLLLTEELLTAARGAGPAPPAAGA
jgi:ribosome maturation factor RimP